MGGYHANNHHWYPPEFRIYFYISKISSHELGPLFSIPLDPKPAVYLVLRFCNHSISTEFKFLLHEWMFVKTSLHGTADLSRFRIDMGVLPN